MRFTNIYNWMAGIAGKEPTTFTEYFYTDIMDYLFPENCDDLVEPVDEALLSENMRNTLLQCSSPTDVKQWMNKVTSHIVMRIDTETIIADYLSAQ